MLQGNRRIDHLKICDSLLRDALKRTGSAHRPEDSDVSVIEWVEEAFPSVRVPDKDWQELAWLSKDSTAQAFA